MPPVTPQPIGLCFNSLLANNLFQSNILSVVQLCFPASSRLNFCSLGTSSCFFSPLIQTCQASQRLQAVPNFLRQHQIKNPRFFSLWKKRTLQIRLANNFSLPLTWTPSRPVLSPPPLRKVHLVKSLVTDKQWNSTNSATLAVFI